MLQSQENLPSPRDIRNQPRLLYFQAAYDPQLPTFLINHAAEHVKCLRQFFDVVVINRDGDFRAFCDEYQPDLAMFESGVPLATCRRPRIFNARSCNDVPKLAFLNADGFGEGRAGFLSDVHHLDVDAVFALATTAPDYLPEIGDRLYFWPNSVDPDVYRDYGQPKAIPVLFTGNANPLYPWRQEVSRRLSKSYPTLLCPHPGYAARASEAHFLVGEAYARMLNAAHLVPTCGTVAKEVVRKHFEIPACRACLITEESAGLLAAGFVDMINCVFVTPDNVRDKVDYLFSNMDVLDRIERAGFNLIRHRHLMAHRSEILQWYLSRRALAAGDKIIQDGPFSPLRIVRGGTDRPPPYRADGLLSDLISRGHRDLLAGRPDAAETLFLDCLNYYSLLPEAQLGMALCNLAKGQPDAALGWVTKPIQFTLAKYDAADPDPVEWAYLIVTLLCQGSLRAAVDHAAQFPGLRHHELDRVRAVVEYLTEDGPLVEREPPVAGRASIHGLPVLSFKEWLQRLDSLLAACGQQTLTRKLSAASTAAARPALPADVDATDSSTAPAKAYFKRRERQARLRMAVRQRFKNLLHGLEARGADFLPYPISRKRTLDAFVAVERAVRAANPRSMLIVGKAANEAAYQAVGRAALPNILVSIDDGQPIGEAQTKMWQSKNWQVVNVFADDPARELIGRDAHDVVILEASSALAAIGAEFDLAGLARGARSLILLGLDHPRISEVFVQMMEREMLRLTDFSLTGDRSYAIFESELPAAGPI